MQSMYFSLIIKKISEPAPWFRRGLLGILVLSFSFFLSLTVDNTCLNYVRKVFDTMNASAFSNKVTYLKYTVTAKLNERDKNDKNIVNSSEFELITMKEKARIYSKEIIVLRDEKNTFTILPQKQMIYWANSLIKDKSVDAYGNLRKMQDSILKYSDKMDCKAVKAQRYNREVAVYLNKKMSEQMQMKKVMYCIDDKKNTLIKVLVDYLPNNQFETIVYVFSEQNTDYQKADMNIPVVNLVFESGNKLQKKYAGYKLIDNRK